MKPVAKKTGLLFISMIITAALLSGCNALNRLSDVGKPPNLASIENPVTRPDYRPVTMPMPAPVKPHKSPNSLWRTGSRAFFKDLRASQIGDIVTVIINVDDQAEIENETTRTRTTSEDASVPSLLGYQAALNAVLPEAVAAASLLDIDSSTSNTGTGSIERDETIELQVAAVVTQILPNGNLVLHGRQEIRVNFEVREIQVVGVIRPEDITNQNNITHEKIAELRVSYGGRGHISDFQQPRYGTQIIDIIFPF
ncbi:MAG: flagellar basal body L-ring protein FlgH [Alphaproteobacteria bacterium]|nr:flagellar basal body L-ring protein FlgH [Alphaproteobacteria bacterium]